jgi:2,3-diaminopropionate biosynthesis protein SbnA
MSRAFDAFRGTDRFAALSSFSPATLRGALDTIGATPVVPIEVNGLPSRHEVLLKLEGNNLTGSIKDRTALGLVQDLQRRGRLPRGATIVESTSGNLGVALAMLARAHELHFVAVVDPNVSPENLAKMLAFGAEIDVVDRIDASGYLSARLERVRARCERDPLAVWTNQYGSPANPLAHRTGTGPEILRQAGGQLDAVFIAVSTCGTLAGIGTYLRAASPATRIIAVDATGSAVFGCPPRRRLLVGIGSSRTPDFAIDGLFDEIEHVDDQEAFACCRALADKTGIYVGGSSGAVIAACVRHLEHADSPRRVMCLCPDNGDNYASTIWSDAWLGEHAIDVAGAAFHFAPGGTRVAAGARAS